MKATFNWDKEARAGYLDLSPYRTKYAGVSTRQVAYEVEPKEGSEALSVVAGDFINSIVIDYDASDRILGIEFF